MSGIVIVGGGQAGIQLADSLRAEGHEEPITIFANEPHLPYQRPPLSKDYMATTGGADPLPLRGESFFVDNAVNLRPHTRVSSINRSHRTVTVDDGSRHAYSSLVLATGTRNRKLDVDGKDLHGIHYLRTLDDAQSMQAQLATARHAVVVGAGFIGLEFAAAARQRGLEVTVLEFNSRPMARVLTETMSAFFTRTHTASGIDLRLGEGIRAFTGTGGHVTGAVGTSGTVYKADIVLIGVGVLPNSELAEEAGLQVDNGIVVDAFLRTSDPDIYALGDCCIYPNSHTGTMMRLESVQNATDQAKALARTLTGRPTAYDSLPWFWSQQGPVKLQIAGIVRDDDETVVRGEPEKGKFSIYCFRDGTLSGVESVSSAAEHVQARKLLGLKVPLSPHQVMDPDFDLKAHIQNARESATV